MKNDSIPAVRVYFPDADRQIILNAIDTCLQNGQVAPGKNVDDFEACFALYTGCRHAVALSSGGSGTSAGS